MQYQSAQICTGQTNQVNVGLIKYITSSKPEIAELNIVGLLSVHFRNFAFQVRRWVYVSFTVGIRSVNLLAYQHNYAVGLTRETPVI